MTWEQILVVALRYMLLRFLIIVLVAIALISGAKLANAQTRVVDGDTLVVDGQRIRLFGIDAPELWQSCNGWPAGRLAKTALEMMTEARDIRCEPKATDKYGRTVAICHADGRDIGAAMVKLGMAWAFVRYSRDYVSEEDFARKNGRGVHAQACELPWDYRSKTAAK